MQKKKLWIPVVVGILIAEAVGALSAFLSGGFGNLYTELEQPPLAPPGWVFPVAWTILYAMMGAASGLIWAVAGDMPQGKNALTLYAVQLTLNFSWSILFFRFQMLGLSVAVILLLTLMVIWTTVAFYRIKPVAGYLMIPYIAWLLFASYLNIGVWVLN